MIKFRWYYDKDREEEFLNSMVTKGYAMTRFFLGVYWFEECKPGEYTYRVDIIRDKSTKQKNEFYDLIRESGGELVETWEYGLFFGKKGDFEIYSDNESKMEQYSRIQKMFLICTAIEMLLLISQSILYFSNKIYNNSFLIVLLVIIIITFMIQIYKCNKKIKSLKK